MKKYLFFILPFVLAACESEISKAKFQGKLNFVCNDSNSLSFSDEVGAEKFPKRMNLNSMTHELCGKKGNVLVYKSSGCDQDSGVARFDFILEELTLNNPPREIVMKCVPK
jgi:hypothetical protein